MDLRTLEKSSLFRGMSESEIESALDMVSYHVEHYEKDDTILRAMDDADRIGVILSGRAQAQKTFPNGSQVNVAVRMSGDMIGPATAFSAMAKYPCDVVAMDTVTVLFFRKSDLLRLMGECASIMQNFTRQLATAAFMLQQRLELFSYSGIAQKAAFSLLMYERQTGKTAFPIPDSITKWAMQMNVSRPSLHRELKKLEADGIIRYAPPVVEIIDRDALQDVLSQ